MRPLLLTVVSIFWLASPLVLGADAQAQSKVKIKDGVEGVRDKSKPVRAALEAQYAKIADAYRHDSPATVLELPLGLSFTIGDIDVHGDTAAALIHQRWSRIQMKKGQLRRVDTSACQRETWINTPEGWRLHLIDSVQPLVWSVDGKRVDPGKRYDPDAPAYAPDVEATSPCTD
jgi:hypothetical protein